MRLGVDLVTISRFARIAAHPAGRRIVFTPAELAYADTLGETRRTEALAGRFCAKEATAKALGRGFGQGLLWRDIEVVKDAYGAPVVELHRGAKALAAAARVDRIDLSLSHQEDLVVCVAVAVPSPPERPDHRTAEPAAPPAAGERTQDERLAPGGDTR